MGGKVLNGCRIYIGFPIPAWKAKTADWSNTKVTTWVKTAGGSFQQQFNEQTATHLVVDEKQWQNKTTAVQTALDANENGQKIHIVSPDWLENCLEEQRKCREGTYLWEKLDQVASSSKQKKRGKSGDDGENAGKDAGEMRRPAPQALLGEVFQEATEPFVAERDLRAWEAEVAGEAKAKKEREEAEAKIKELGKLEAEKKRKERAELMRKTVKRGRGEVFNENYHAWVDGTGFVYDIMLTKVDTLTNSNERINLTIFESNTASPRTYATNLHFAGTGKCPMNNVLAAIGCNLNTAMRVFRQAFQEKTGCNWDDRLKAYNERIRARQEDLERYGAIRGVSLESRSRAAEDAVPFALRAFEYMPPKNASKGLLPDGSDEVPEVVRLLREQPDQAGMADDSMAAETVDLDMLLNGTGPDFDATSLPVEDHQFEFGPLPFEMLPFETQPDQTQLAFGVGEDLLNLDNDENFAVAHKNKRKRGDSEDVEGEEKAPVAKKASAEHLE